MTLARMLLPVALVLSPGNSDIVDVPTVLHGVRDTPVPDQFRPVLDIHYDGKIFHEKDLLYDPEVDGVKEDPFLALREWLAGTANRMKKDHIDQRAGEGPLIPDEPILLRPDRSAAFRYVQKCMEACGGMGVQIWKIQLACRTPEGADGRLAAYLPKDVGVNQFDAEPVEKLEVIMRVFDPGTKLQPGASRKVATVDSGRFVYGEDRALQYAVGPFKTKDLDALKRRLAELHRAAAEEDEKGARITIDARAGTIYEDVTGLLDVVLEVGLVDITFVGAYD